MFDSNIQIMFSFNWILMMRCIYSARWRGLIISRFRWRMKTGELLMIRDSLLYVRLSRNGIYKYGTLNGRTKVLIAVPLTRTPSRARKSCFTSKVANSTYYSIVTTEQYAFTVIVIVRVITVCALNNIYWYNIRITGYSTFRLSWAWIVRFILWQVWERLYNHPDCSSIVIVETCHRMSIW